MAYEQERKVPDPTAGVQDPVVGNTPEGAGNTPGHGAGSDPRVTGARVPDARGDGFEAGTAGAHGAAPVRDSVAEAGPGPAADVRGSGFEAEEASRHTSGPDRTSAAPAAPGSAAPGPVGAGPADTGAVDDALLSAGERERLERRLQGAVSGFVDEPRAAVEEADRVLGETVAPVTALLTERSNSLRLSWHGEGGQAGTEELRQALRTYREVTERLLEL
ncbi:hypothetical protein [Streptomyces sp. NPDC059398]|uniref:hypothetical protein n=1 Tax=Streptomyces sp. NPDC059398 TaxID=3346820 RepID=UPI0036AC7B12